MTASPEPMYDVVIVGGGPAGLSAALFLGRALRKVVVIDAGEPRNAAAREFHGFLGRDSTDPRALLLDGREELAKYGVTIVDDVVLAAECLATSERQTFETGFRVATKGGISVSSRKLLFATGMRDELPELSGTEDCYGVTVHHCPYCDGWEHRGEHLLAYGKRAKEAVGLGLALRGWSERVTVLTNGHAAGEEDRRRLAQNGIACREERLVRLVYCGDRLQGVEFENREILPAAALFFSTDQRPHSELPRALGCEFDDPTARTSRKQRTNVPGLFLAGDADGDVQFVIVAAAEGATAAVAINRELQDEDRV